MKNNFDVTFVTSDEKLYNLIIDLTELTFKKYCIIN